MSCPVRTCPSALPLYLQIKNCPLSPQILALCFVSSIPQLLGFSKILFDDFLSLDRNIYSVQYFSVGSYVSSSKQMHTLPQLEGYFPLIISVVPFNYLYSTLHASVQLLSYLSVLLHPSPGFRSGGYKLPPTCLYLFS